MPKQLQLLPEFPDVEQIFSLDGQQYRVRIQWRKRVQHWYISISKEGSGEVLVDQQAINPGTSMLGPYPEPPGALVVTGPSDYNRMDLNDNLRVVYYEADSLERIDSPEDFDVY